MIDQFFSTVGQLRAYQSPANYSPDRAITYTEYIPPHEATGELTVVFPPWHVPKRLLKQLGKNLTNDGNGAILYDFNEHILNDDPGSVVKSFGTIVKEVSHHVNSLNHLGKYAEINLLGFSLGNVALAMTAEKLDRFDDVTMVVPGADLLESLWYGIRTQRLKQALLNSGTTYKDLVKKWDGMGPVHQVPAFRGHEVAITLSQTDEFIPYRFGVQLVEALEEDGQKPVVNVVERHGHAWTIYDYLRNV